MFVSELFETDTRGMEKTHLSLSLLVPLRDNERQERKIFKLGRAVEFIHPRR